MYLKNADAVKLATVLRAAYSGGSGGAARRRAARPRPTASPVVASTAGGASPQATAPVAQSASPSTGGFVQADPATNALIITAPEPMYKQLRVLIDQLDSRRAQVYIESMIVEVAGDDAANFGLQWQGLLGRNGDSNGIVAGTNFGTTGNLLTIDKAQVGGGTAAASLTLGEGLNIGWITKIAGTYGLAAIANILQSRANTNIVSTPNLITLDNEEAKIIVGSNVPFITGQFTNTGTATTSPFQTIERKDVGITLRIKPQIGEGGTVRMVIFQESSSLSTAVAPGTSNAGPSTNKRSIESTVVVDDGQILVLGGLIEDKYTDNRVQDPAARRHPLPRRIVPQRHTHQDAHQPDGVPAPDHSSAKKKKANTSATTTSNARFVICPYTEQKVYIARATLADIKSLNNNSRGQKRLWTISSQPIRQDHYQQVAQALAQIEQDILPSYGGRSWEVAVNLKEPNGRVLFRSFRGKMELAVLPHLIDRIPKPPVWPGTRCQPKDEYELMDGEEAEAIAKKKHYKTEQEYIQSLKTREITTLSSVANELLRKYNHPVPSVSINFKSPDGKHFTSRKAAWEYATELSKKEVTINRNILGIGASGKLLQPFIPSAKIALDVGKLRFERDGLWVIGQELTWQSSRPEEYEQQQLEETQAASQKVYTSGLQLYIATNRLAYKEKHDTNLQTADKELRQQWRTLSPKEQQKWNDKVKEQFSDSDSEAEERKKTR